MIAIKAAKSNSAKSRRESLIQRGIISQKGREVMEQKAVDNAEATKMDLETKRLEHFDVKEHKKQLENEQRQSIR